jgi:hypothetical protein
MSRVLRVSKTIPAAMDLLQNRRDRRSSGKGMYCVVLFSDEVQMGCRRQIEENNNKLARVRPGACRVRSLSPEEGRGGRRVCWRGGSSLFDC